MLQCLPVGHMTFCLYAAVTKVLYPQSRGPYYAGHTMQATLFRPYYAGHTLQATLCRPHYAGHTIQAILCRPHFAGHTMQATLSRPHYPGHTMQATLCRPHYAGHTLQATHYTALLQSQLMAKTHACTHTHTITDLNPRFLIGIFAIHNWAEIMHPGTCTCSCRFRSSWLL